MIKKILVSVFIFIAIGLGFLKLLLYSINIEWGHHFSFENELGIEIDSLEISVGGITTMIHAGSDSLRSLESNIDVPESGYPHSVILKIYSGAESMKLEADSFNCFNCDGNHEYILTNSGARYRFLN